MKIGILTQRLGHNYGCLLQNYALQQTLIRAGHEVETIDWEVSDPIHRKMSRFKWNLISIVQPDRTDFPKCYMPTGKQRLVIYQNTNHFIDTYIHHTKAVTKLSGFEKLANKRKYDGYVVGSDQCWRPKYNRFLPAMYLSFARDKDVKRIAYAASFGSDEWEMTPQTTAFCTPLAKQFDIVTVREDSGVRLCKEHFGVNAIQVLDPTMLLSKEDYINLIEAENEPRAQGTLFSYILDPNPHITSFISKVANDMKLEPFQVLPKYQDETRSLADVKKHIEDCIFPRVTTWLRAFMDAEMTIVDSFHGMVFSLIFNKPFWVIGNAQRGLTRFTSLLKLFNLEDRLLNENELNIADYKHPIEWKIVNELLEKNRSESRYLLLNSL